MTRATVRYSISLFLCLGLVISLPGGIERAAAADYRHFPGAPFDTRTQRIQEQVELLYTAQEFERALLIYEKELARAGDKYAQYMVGFMTLTGRGVEENPPVALAWYRLAAERNGNPYVKAYDALAASLDAADRQRADAMFAQLQIRAGDRKLLLDWLRADLDALARHGPSTTGDEFASAALASGFLAGSARADRYRRIRERIVVRIDYLDGMQDATRDDPQGAALRQQELGIREEVATLPDY